MMGTTRFTRPRRAFLLVASLLAPVAVVFATWTAHAVGPRPAYQVICHPGTTVDTVERRFLQDAFLKKVSTWPGGQELRPVDLAPNAPARRLFSETVLKRPVEAVRNYWQQHIFAGRDLPPPEVNSESEVVRYVLGHGGAVGYISAETAAVGVKVLTVR